MIRGYLPESFVLTCIVMIIVGSPMKEIRPSSRAGDLTTKTYSSHNETSNFLSVVGSRKFPNEEKRKYCIPSYNMSALMEKVTRSSGYNVHIMPGFEKGKSLEVKIALTVLAFRDLREVDMTYTVDFFLRTKWVDKRLVNPFGCVLTMTMGKKHPSEIIWVPDTMIENSVTSHLHEVLTNNHKIDISPDGNVFWSTRVTVKAMCNMNLLKFPRDKQTCSIILLSYTYPTELAHYVWDKVNPVGVMDETLSQLSQFDLISYNKTSYNVLYAAGEYSILEAKFVFERRMGYYLIQVYIPCVFLVILAGLSFWVDSKSTPARIALGLTTLLTIATVWSAANTNMPPVNYVKATDIYFLTSFCFVLATLLEYIIVLNYNPLKLKLKQKLYSCKKTRKDKENDSLHLNHNANCVKRRSVTVLTPTIANIDRTDLCSCVQKETLEENKIVSCIDKTTRWLYPLAYVAFNIVYWYQLSSE